jgi:hypothetical protein
MQDIFSGTDSGSGAMDDFNRLTNEGKQVVSPRATSMFHQLQQMAENKDRKGMERMIETAQTPAERQALIAASEQLLRKGGKGQIDEKTTRALMNEYARQEIAKNPRLTKEGAYADEMTKRKLADEQQHNKDAKQSLAERKAAIPKLAKKQVDDLTEALKDRGYKESFYMCTLILVYTIIHQIYKYVNRYFKKIKKQQRVSVILDKNHPIVIIYFYQGFLHFFINFAF